MSGRVHQEDPTKLKGTVTQAAKDRTITGTATVTPSGDMARKAYYDRDPSIIVQAYEATLGAHATTTRWTYTVPENRNAIHSVCNQTVDVAIATATKVCFMRHNVNTDAQTFGVLYHHDGSGFATTQLTSAPFLLGAGDSVYARTYSDDTVNHAFWASSILTEFDE